MTDVQSDASNLPSGTSAEHPESVGRYKIIRRLGEGGMGSVFLAQDTVLRREVALKLPLTGTENDSEVRERFLREARSAATLDHPYICQVYDADEADGRPYLAMAYIEGKTLADLVRAEGMPPRQVVALVGKLAIAMQEAHLRGVVHRDLKPRNVMIRTVGSKREPVIVDFGLARLESMEDVRMTRTGQVMGTPAYMAPEQLRGNPDEIGPPCDIYALGVILYELLTGQLPFSGVYAVVVAQILTQPPQPPSARRPGLEPELDAICLKAMAKDVSVRYGSMIELATALTGYLRGAPSVSDRTVAPISRPIEADSIPTGADTLVSQFLKIDENEDGPPSVEIDRARSGVGRESKSPPSPRTLMGLKRRAVIIIVPAIVGLFVLGGIIVVTNNSGNQPKVEDAVLTDPASSVDPVPQVVANVETTPLPAPPTETKKVGPPAEIPKPRDIPKTVPATPGPSNVVANLIENKIGMKLKLIPNGEFFMGVPDTEPEGQEDEKPRHRVRITRPFYLGIYEVTQAEFETVMGANPSHFSANGGGSQNVAGLDKARLPAENIVWLDAIAFCIKLSEREGLRPCYNSNGEVIANGTGYRLPTEAEWEYACRAGTTTAFAFGDQLTPTMANYAGNFSYNGSPQGTPRQHTMPVGSYSPNGFGLFDMHGNVREWCSDPYYVEYYKKLVVDDPPDVPWDVPPGSVRVDRGGSWRDDPQTCRSTRRIGNSPIRPYYTIGFRVARDL